MGGFQPTRIIERTRFEAELISRLAGVVMDAGATIRAKRVCKHLPTIGLSLEGFQLPSHDLKVISMNAHCQAKGASRLGLANGAMTCVSYNRFAGYDVPNCAAFAAAIVRIGHQTCPLNSASLNLLQ
jgi:hypothetical protein